MTAPPQRRWYAFRLRTLLVVVVVLGCVLTPLAIRAKNLRYEKPTVAWVLKNGGAVEYGFWGRVRRVDLPGLQIHDVTPLMRLTALQLLNIRHSRVEAKELQRLLTALNRCVVIGGGPNERHN